MTQRVDDALDLAQAERLRQGRMSKARKDFIAACGQPSHTRFIKHEGQVTAREVAAQRGVRVQREQTLVQDGRHLGRERPRASHELRELRARNLDFDGLED